MRWLRSPSAIMAHLLFLTVIGLLTYAIIMGEEPPASDYQQALVFCGIAYPGVLFLLWVRKRINGGDEF